MTLKYGPKTVFPQYALCLRKKGAGCDLGNIYRYKDCRGFKIRLKVDLQFVGFMFCRKTKVYLSDCRVKDKRRHEIRNESKQLKMEKEHDRL